MITHLELIGTEAVSADLPAPDPWDAGAAPTIRVCIGPHLTLRMDPSMAECLADALVEAIAELEDRSIVLARRVDIPTRWPA